MSGLSPRFRALAVSAAVSLAIITLVSACSASSGEAAFLAKSDTGLVYVRWTNANGQLAGSVIRFDASNLEQGGGTSKTIAFTGLASGSSVTLNFEAGSPDPAWTGRLSGDKLILSIPDQSGHLSDVELGRADDSAYNATVTVFAAAQRLSTAVEALQNTARVEDLLPSWRRKVNSVGRRQALDRLKFLQGQLQQGTSDEPRLVSEMRDTYAFFFCTPVSPPSPNDDPFRTITVAVQDVVAAADNLDRTVTDNPVAQPPMPTSASARDAASRTQSSLSSALATLEPEVESLMGMDAEAKVVYDSALALAGQHGIAPVSPLPSCVSP